MLDWMKLIKVMTVVFVVFVMGILLMNWIDPQCYITSTLGCEFHNPPTLVDVFHSGFNWLIQLLHRIW